MNALSWPAPLLRQILILSGLAGIFASRHFWPGLTAWLLILLHQHVRIAQLRGIWSRTLFWGCLALAFGSGWFYGQAHSTDASKDSAVSGRQANRQEIRELWETADNHLETPAPPKAPPEPRLRAKVLETQGRADRRLRLILEILQTDPPRELPPGRLVFTWQNSLTPEGHAGPAASRTSRRTQPPGNGEILPRRPVPWDELELTLRPREMRGLSNFGLWNVEEYWDGQGVRLRAWAEDAEPRLHLPDTGRRGPSLWREQLRLLVLESLPLKAGKNHPPEIRDGARLIPALLFGDQYLLDSADLDLFARSTLAHSLALSGMHLGYAATLGYLAVRFLYFLFPGLGLHLPRPQAALLSGVAVALLYLWLGGVPPSLLRAFLMLAFLGAQLWRKKAGHLADALLAALALILLVNPEAAFELSLQLSALSLAAICLILPLGQQLNSRLARFPKPLRGLLLLLLTSVGIQILLAPLLVRSFGFLGLSLPLNLIWLPLLGFLTLPLSFAGLLAAGLFLPELAELLFFLASLPADGLFLGLRRLDQADLLPVILLPRPHWLSMLAYWFLLSLIPSLLKNVARARGQPRRRLYLHLLAGLLLLAAPPLWRLYDNSREVVRLRLLDVGQGQAALLEWPGGSRLLLDGGGSAFSGFDVGREIIAPTLADNRLPRLDYMLASHLDADHAQGLIFPLRRLPVGFYADNGQVPSKLFSRELIHLLQDRGLPRHRLQAGDVLQLAEELRLEILHPAGNQAGSNENSLVARLVWRGQGLVMLCGDVGKKAQRQILEYWRESEGITRLKAQVLILPHHGSAGSLLPDFYRAVSPNLALVSAGWENPWHLPSYRVKNALLDLGIPLLSTASCGQIHLEWKDPLEKPTLDTARRNGP
ncbi:MAG: DNA internalization-related competence protein ComEC/Rec2 [Desulfovibrionaceae bacterium]|nr:DNA internalization-related competence protein ComEC/Rec2 [Desulfovibrionaceae bacterium]